MIRNNFFSFQDIEAVIFDFDGTLADSDPLHHLTDTELLRQYNVDCSLLNKDKYYSDDVFEKMREVKNNYCIPDTLDKMIVKRNKIYLNLAIEQLKLYPQMKDLINKLADMNMAMAVASGTFNHILNCILEKMEIKRHFSAVVSNEDDKTNRNIADLYIEAANKMNVEQRNVVVFEGNVGGVVSAKKNGMKCIAIPNDTSRINRDFMKADVLYANGMKEFSVRQLFHEYS